MDLQEMSRINMDRCKVWHEDPREWSVNDWAVAAGGEMGEAQNLCKKLRRMTSNIDSPNNPPSVDECIALIGKEIADTFWYLDLLAQRLGLDLQTIAIEKFNEISEREQLPQKMPHD